MYLNIRGIKSKLDSLMEKIEEIEPAIICITETHLLEKEEINFDGYSTPFRNDKDNLSGGILVAVKKELKGICTVVEKTKEIGQTLWIVINNNRVKIRLGVVYAPQESRTSKENLKKMYDGISDQVLKAKEKQQSTVLVGDFNGKIGEVIRGNRPDVTKGGKLMLKLVKNHNLVILNQSDKCQGLWTRSEGSSKSVLDYAIIDDESESAFLSMVIDEEREFSPASYDQNHVSYSDHNVLILEFNWVLMEIKKEKARKRDVMTTKGYIRYRDELKQEQVADILIQNDGDCEQKYGEWKRKVEEIAKRNTTTLKRKNPRRIIKDLVKKKREKKKELKRCGSKERKLILIQLKLINQQIKNERNKQFNGKIQKVVHKLKCKKGINGPNMWEVLKWTRRRKVEEATAIKSRDGVVLEDPDEIKDRYLEHFVDILKPPEAFTEQEKEQEEIINLIFNNIMRLADSMEPHLTTKEEITKARLKLKKKKCKDPYGWYNELIIEGGEEMDKSLLYLFNRMETERFTPKQWHEVTIKTISKQGSILEMDNKRGLFLTEAVSKLYETVLKNRNDENIKEYISDFQNGGVKKRSPADNTLIFSEIIRQNKKLNRKTYVVYGDAVKCFDKLWLKDCLVELYKADCPPQDIQMMYLMNKDTVIEVITPSGATNKVEIGEVAKQGTVLGPTFCCVETDQINKIGEDQERPLGNQKVAILIFVDDVMSAGTADNIRSAIHNMAEMETIKKFTFGLKKTNFMVIDSARGKPEEIREEVKSGAVKETDEYKYVGFWINKKGNCQLQIQKKKGKLKGEIIALKSVASYYNMGETFVNVRLQLYESCIIQSLLYNMEAWCKQSKGELKNLEQIQGRALCTLLELPRSTPYIGLLCELGIWRIEERLMYRKLMFYNNLWNSDDRRLAKRIVVEQENENDLDGSFFGTVKDMALSIDLSLDDLKSLKKSQLKKQIKKKLNDRMLQVISATIPRMTKLRFLNIPNSFERKQYISYLSGKETIETIRVRLNMIVIYDNYHGDVTLKRLCLHCEGADDTTEHLIECPVFHSTLSSNLISNESNVNTWRQLLEIIRVNMDYRTSSSSWKRTKKKNAAGQKT